MKKIKYILLFILVSFLGIGAVHAATGSIKATTTAGTVAVGSTFTVTVTVNCSEALGSWSFDISYDSAYISLQSGDTSVAAYGDGTTKTKTYTYKFKAIKSGKANVKVVGPLMVTWKDENTLFTPSSSNASVTVKTQAEIEASYSKDNTLKSLIVEGYKLSPAFDKNTTNYKLDVNNDVTSLKVSAQVNDSRARVNGVGTINVSEGLNRIEILVTAQNGSIKTYVIEVDVKDLNPINITLDGREYTVVKKAELLSTPTGYVSSQIKINELDIPSFHSDITEFTLVGLKDDAGKIGLYIYDADKKSYTKYDEIKGVTLTLYPKKNSDLLENFYKIKLKINEIEYDAYQSTLDENFILIYAVNVETGETGFYSYNKEENSFQIYSSNIYDSIADEREEFNLFTFGLGALSIILFLIVIAQSAKNRKLKRLCKKYVNKQKEKLELEAIQKAKEEKKEEPEVDEEFRDVKKSKKQKKNQK